MSQSETDPAHVLAQETAFLLYLKQAKVALNQYELPTKLSNVQSQARCNVVAVCWLMRCAQLENLIEKNYYLHRSAKDAYRSYLQSYASHSLKNVGLCESIVHRHLGADLQRAQAGSAAGVQGVWAGRAAARQPRFVCSTPHLADSLHDSRVQQHGGQGRQAQHDGDHGQVAIFFSTTLLLMPRRDQKAKQFKRQLGKGSDAEGRQFSR